MRTRATLSQMVDRNGFLRDYAARHGPITIRGLYYQAVVAGLDGISKDKAGYRKIQQAVLRLRRAGHMPYGHIADLTRWMRKPQSYSGIEQALRETARFYRKWLWQDAAEYVEAWCEKDALAGVIQPVTELYDVPLMIPRGFASETFCYEAARAAQDYGRTYVVYYLGDFDRAGRDAANSLEEKLEGFAIDRDITVEFVNLAIDHDHIVRYDGEALSQPID